MTLLITVFAAVIATLVWYKRGFDQKMALSTLCYLYWGAAIMWFVDAIYEYAELGAAYFTPEPMDMLNDLFLGFSVVAFGLVIWLVVLMVKDPQGIVKASMKRK